MISLIVCCRNSSVAASLSENVAQTIGTQYEWVVVDNTDNKYSIFEAYNLGVARSHGDLLCFMHDDLCFHTHEWGKVATERFQQDDQLGLMGFAGAHFLPNVPMYWYSSPFISEHNLTNDNGQVLERFKDYRYVDGLAEVVAVDGFCFFVRRSLFDTVRFDDRTYKGFHAYDMDICMQVQKGGYKVCVCDEITIEHFWSESGAKTKAGVDLFERNLELFRQKWQHQLPIWRGLGDVPQYEMDRLNLICTQAYEVKRIRRSRAYRLGRRILHPFKKK